MAGIQTKTNPALDRARKIAGATPAQINAARADYQDYVSANRALNSTPIAFDSYLAEWLDARRAERLETRRGTEPDDYQRRDYSQLYSNRSE